VFVKGFGKIYYFRGRKFFRAKSTSRLPANILERGTLFARSYFVFFRLHVGRKINCRINLIHAAALPMALPNLLIAASISAESPAQRVLLGRRA
jgi:hypothetical protein